MKIGDFVIYRRSSLSPEDSPDYSDIGVVTKLNYEGGTVQALNTRGKLVWYVWSGCEVIYESR